MTLHPFPFSAAWHSFGRAALVTVLAVVTALSLPACAQSPQAPMPGDGSGQASQEDPPARVGRLSLVQGDVQWMSEAGSAWEAARVNWPVTGGNAVFVAPGARSEVRIGSTAVHLDGNTQARFAQLDDHGVVVELTEGSVRTRLRSLPQGDLFSLGAEGVRADALQPGDYRASIDPDSGALQVAVLQGSLRLVTPSNTIELAAGQQARLEEGGRRFEVGGRIQSGDFDRWADARNREQDRLAALQHVSPEMTGAEDLDRYGNWSTESDYGSVWYPSSLPPAWAPYRYGHWAWVRPWGWTWIDDAPWGYAPFHYGRWVQIGGRWGWAPGPLAPRPIWAPALVGFVGGSSGHTSWSVGVGGGAPVGWFPLAPYEYYQPWYGHSPRYGYGINPYWRDRDHRGRDRDRDDNDRDGDRRVRIPSNPVAGIRDGDYRYQRQPDALTVVGEDDFRGSRPIGRGRVPVDRDLASQLRPVTQPPGLRDGPGRIGIQPGRPDVGRGDQVGRGSDRTPAAPGLVPNGRPSVVPGSDGLLSPNRQDRVVVPRPDRDDGVRRPDRDDSPRRPRQDDGPQRPDRSDGFNRGVRPEQPSRPERVPVPNAVERRVPQAQPRPAPPALQPPAVREQREVQVPSARPPEMSRSPNVRDREPAPRPQVREQSSGRPDGPRASRPDAPAGGRQQRER